LSWIQKLYETYDRCAGLEQFDNAPLMPINHTEQQTHLEITLNANGNFLRAAVVPKETIFIPATEDSAGRTSGPIAHPLVDKLQYVAADYEAFGGVKDSQHALYLRELRAWTAVEPNAKVQAVLRYVENGTVIADLVREGLLPCDQAGKLMTEWPPENGTPPLLFKVLTAKAGKRDVGDAFVRWSVETPGKPGSHLWQDEEVQRSWIRFIAAQEDALSLCMVTGEELAPAASHPKRLRHGADGAKLISSNDTAGYTFRGRFDSPEQAYGLGSVTTQKAHNALRWLIARQGYKQADQAIVAWAVAGQPLPPVIAGSDELTRLDATDTGGNFPEPYEGDAGQLFTNRLNRMISGYAAHLTERDDIVVMALDSATPGRMAITYYRELSGSEFLERIRDWHEQTAWPQNMGKDRRFTGAPAPRDIAEAAYGRRADEKLRKSTVERLLPSIVDRRAIPRDLVEACAQRAANRAGQEHWEWERTLGIACALVRGSRREEHYSMSLEEHRTKRDYLFGRLLAVAEKIEGYALYLQGEKRDTTAERLMQRFADHPAATWRTIELALRPYMARLQTSRGGALHVWRALLDEITAKFQGDDFTRSGRLDAEFLLGYHCQRAAFMKRESPPDSGSGPADLSDDTIHYPGDFK
jgi:CRISPR-associated protein Csd1